VRPVRHDGDEADARDQLELDAQILADGRMVLRQEHPDLPRQVGRSIKR
jgi:hypothetical protein